MTIFLVSFLLYDNTQNIFVVLDQTRQLIMTGGSTFQSNQIFCLVYLGGPCAIYIDFNDALHQIQPKRFFLQNLNRQTTVVQLNTLQGYKIYHHFNLGLGRTQCVVTVNIVLLHIVYTAYIKRDAVQRSNKNEMPINSPEFNMLIAARYSGRIYLHTWNIFIYMFRRV